MSSETNLPSAEEQREQLNRILLSDTFASQPKLRELLERLVEDTFNETVGGKDYETVLALEVFGKPKDWRPGDGGVRQRMLHLRDRLGAYYSAEGSRDRVGIRFPLRSGYAARFFYRKDDEEESFQYFAGAFRYTFPDLLSCNDIIAEMRRSIHKAPSYAPAYAGYAEALLACAMCDTFDVLPYSLLEAEEAIRTGMGLSRNVWRMHVVAGAIHCCRFAWDKAHASFKAALRLAPSEAGAHCWYAAFLLAVGQREEAMKSVYRRLKRAKTRLTPYIHPLFLYVTRDFAKAYDEMPTKPTVYVADVVRMREGEWPAELLMSCLCMENNISFARWGYADIGAEHSGVGAFKGLSVLMLMSLVNLFSGYRTFEEKGVSLFNDIERDGTRPISLALAYMGMGKPGEAIEQLERACDIGHPLMVWLHLWPVLDPLREDPRFKSLIKRMNLP